MIVFETLGCIDTRESKAVQEDPTIATDRIAPKATHINVHFGRSAGETGQAPPSIHLVGCCKCFIQTQLRRIDPPFYDAFAVTIF
jgi:hypothetical protein